MKIWQRSLFRQIFTLFIFILSALFAIYLFIDLSVHNLKFRQGGYGTKDISLYYLYNFSSLIDLFVPFAFLLASLKVLLNLTAHLEILSLQMAGLSKKRILVPFFILASALSSLSYVNHEWIAPKAAIFLKNFKLNHSAKKQKFGEKMVLSTRLEDGSTLVYHFVDQEKKVAEDLFWIRSPEDIWHMKTLLFATAPPIANFPDHFIAIDGLLSKQESFVQKAFPEIKIQDQLIPSIFFPNEAKSLSTLWKERGDSASVKAHLHHKLALPLFSFLILFAIAPIAFIHSRDRRIFSLVGISILSFIIVMILSDTFLLLGTNEFIEPWVAMWIVPLSIFCLTIRKFARL